MEIPEYLHEQSLSQEGLLSASMVGDAPLLQCVRML